MNRTFLALAVAVLILSLGGGASYWLYDSQRRSLVEDASRDLDEAREAFTWAFNHIFEPALALPETIADSGAVNRPVALQADLFFAAVAGVVQRYPQLNGAYLGFPDGRFLHVQDLDLDGAVVRREPDPSDSLLRRRIIDRPRDDPVGRWQVLDRATGTWLPTAIVSKPYDPRSRGWFQDAVAARAPVWTDTYTFASSGRLGVTYAVPLYDRAGTLWAVMGVDLSLSSLSGTLVSAATALAEIGDVVFATDLGESILGHPGLIEHADEIGEDLEAFLERYRHADSVESLVLESVTDHGRVETIRADGHAYLATMSRLDPQQAMPMQIYLARDLDRVLAGAVSALTRNVALLFGAIVVFAVVATYAVKLRVEVAARQRAEAELIVARDQAEAATRAKSVFLATMSHEIRTPMNGVMSMAELLTTTRLDAEQRGMAKVIGDSATALLTIINDILDFSKIEAGKLEIETVAFSLIDVVGGSAELLAPRAEDKGLTLSVNVDPTLADARLGDPTRIRQILLNLGGNAIKFTERGAIGIAVTAGSGDRLHFRVTDTGIGLTPEQQGRLFQAFVQADSSTSRRYGGTGLGLSICQRLTDLMGGSIGVESRAGEGSAFWFELPLPPRNDAPPRPADDLSSARVRLVGLPADLATIADRDLRAAGVTDVACLHAPPAAADADLWIVDCGHLALTDSMVDGLAGTLALVGSRADLAELPGALRSRADLLLTRPLLRPALWRTLAVSLGLEAAGAVAADVRHDLAFAPPEIDEARAARALVLVAEDNPTNQTVIRKMLGRMGFACVLADNGRIALDMLATPGCGLLLTDVNIPEMDGFELARTVRAREAGGAARLPIVALTADAMSGTEDACLQAGMDGFLTKPIDSRQLGATLERLLPQALALRRPVTGAHEAEPAPAKPGWDTDIFDPTTLGGLDDEGCELVRSAADSWVAKVADIEAALSRGDTAAARSIVHALKGASLSVGARRLGRVAADLQDALDNDDPLMTELTAELLEPTLTEFRDLLPTILKS